MKKKLLITSLLLLGSLVGYWRVAGNQFIQSFDDAEYITQNAQIQNGLTVDGIKWAFTSGYAANWHPVTWISHMLDIQFFGLNPAGHHLMSLLLHLANTVILFFLLNRMTGGLWQSAFVAAIFALHPLHVESVAFVAERKDVLSTLFLLLTTWAYLLWTKRPTRRRYTSMMLLYALGLMTKPMLVTLPFVLLLLDYWPLSRMTARSDERTKTTRATSTIRWRTLLPLISEKFPLFLLAAASGVVTMVVQRQYTAVQSTDVFPMTTRIANALASYLQYLEKTVWPENLAFYYPHQGESLPVWQLPVALVILVAIMALVFRVRYSKPYLAVGWLWYLGTLVPVIGLVQVGGQALADRYMYVPMIGLLLMAAWGINDVTSRWAHRRTTVAIASGGLMIVLIILTQKQVGFWGNSFTLLQRAVDVTENNWLAHNNLGFAYFQQGKMDDALSHLGEAVRINPNYTQAHINMAIVLDGQGRTKEAREHYIAALRLNNNLPEAHCNVGIGFYREGRNEEAISHYVEALRLKPDFFEAHVNLATALVDRGEVDQALKHYSVALKINNNLPEVHFVAAVHYQGQGQIQEAISHYGEALRLKPDYTLAHINLGSVLYGQRRFQEAAEHFEAALRIDPGSQEARNNLAAVRAAMAR